MGYSLMGDEDILRDLAEKLEAIRLSKRLKDTELEAAGGISRQLISDFRKGKRSISLKSFLRILRGLGELDRLEDLFADSKSFSPLKSSNQVQIKRVRDKENKTEDFQWGDEG